jgi:hypothetical protein
MVQSNHVPVAQIRLLVVISGYVIALHHAKAGQKAVYGDLAEWACI